jgi:hypothetical protein
MAEQDGTGQGQVESGSFEQFECFLIHAITIACFVVVLEQEKEVLSILVILQAPVVPCQQLERGKRRDRHDPDDKAVTHLHVQCRCQCFGVAHDAHDDVHVGWPGNAMCSLFHATKRNQIQRERVAVFRGLVMQ